jgi:hypothetical protein
MCRKNGEVGDEEQREKRTKRKRGERIRVNGENIL